MVDAMGLTYFKRYRMEIELRDLDWSPRSLPQGFRLLAWSESLLEAHAEAKYRSFYTELDANVFPCLGDRDGCLRLMTEITRRANFLPLATWLLQREVEGAYENCGTVQGVADRNIYGAIQNLGIVSLYRGQGLGTELLRHALRGFHQAGLPRAYLEVTAQNEGALRLYQRFGFHITKTVYKAAEVALA
jgi:ribosomal protein S18 acetylase RimI-like enzyme